MTVEVVIQRNSFSDMNPSLLASKSLEIRSKIKNLNIYKPPKGQGDDFLPVQVTGGVSLLEASDHVWLLDVTDEVILADLWRGREVNKLDSKPPGDDTPIPGKIKTKFYLSRILLVL